MLHGDRKCVLVLIGGRNGVAGGGVNFQEGGIGNGGPHDQGHIMGSRVMFRVIQAGRVGEVGVGAAQLSRLFIHPIRKGFQGAGDVFRQSLSDFIGGRHQKTVEAVADRQFFPCLLYTSRISPHCVLPKS